MSFLATETRIPRLPCCNYMSLFPRYPGSKRKHHLRYLRLTSPDVFVSPFLGAGHTALASNSPIKFVAEKENGVRCMWEMWRGGRKIDILRWFDYIQNFPWVENTHYSWLHLKELWQMSEAAILDPCLSAAVALAIRKLTRNGTVRCNRKGGLNVVAVASQLPEFLTYTPTFPDVVGEWHIYSDAFECIRAYNRSGIEGSAAALIDPPYYRPWEGGRRGTGSMTPVYRHHDPNSHETIQLMTGSITELGNNPFIDWIVATNYSSSELDTAVKAAVDKVWYRPRKITSVMNNGVLDAMSSKRYKAKTAQAPDVLQGQLFPVDSESEEYQRISKTSEATEAEYWIE